MTTNQKPFERIALSLSGGGTRAVGFHLGTLSYLDRVGLLEKVRMLSTVSGGSAVGIGYAVYTTLPEDGQRPLMKLYGELRESLPRDPAQLVGLLQKAYDRRPVAPSGRRTLIANMAELYNHLFKFCDDRIFDVFWEHKSTHLEEIVFNATEFRTGVGFRFHRSSTNKDGASGSEFACLPAEYARLARLCDILAASTCIPVGFEPIEFPDDFRWPDDTESIPKTRKVCDDISRELPGDPAKPDDKKSITLMDGGVYDNQGVFSILKILGLTYDDRRDREKADDGYIPRDINLAGMFGGGGREEPAEHRGHDIDLFIVSDTPIREIPIYEMSKKPQKAGFLDPEKLKWIISITLLLLTGSTLFMGYAYFSTILSDPHRLGHWQSHIWDMFIYVIPLLLLLVCVGGGFFLSGRFKKYFGSSPAFHNNPELRHRIWRYIKKRKFSDIGYLIEARLSSAIAMSTDIFMNRIRFLGLARVFNLPPLKGKVIINVIDAIIRDKKTVEEQAARSEKQNESMAALLNGVERLCDDTIAKASSVGTKFWLATEDMADLLACGQATMCYNLLRHMDEMKKRNSPEVKSDHFQNLYNQAAKDWESLKANPYYLMNDPYKDLI